MFADSTNVLISIERPLYPRGCHLAYVYDKKFQKLLLLLTANAKYTVSGTDHDLVDFVPYCPHLPEGEKATPPKISKKRKIYLKFSSI